jgi:hypothetical protein
VVGAPPPPSAQLPAAFLVCSPVHGRRRAPHRRARPPLRYRRRGCRPRRSTPDLRQISTTSAAAGLDGARRWRPQRSALPPSRWRDILYTQARGGCFLLFDSFAHRRWRPLSASIPPLVLSTTAFVWTESAVTASLVLPPRRPRGRLRARHRSLVLRASAGVATIVLWICTIGKKLCYNRFLVLHYEKIFCGFRGSAL